MGRAWDRCLERRVERAASFDKLGALCLLTPFLTSIILRSLSPLIEELYYGILEYIETQQPALVFVVCNLIVLAITILGQPYKNKVPSNLLHLPFKPVEVINLAPTNEVDYSVPLRRYGRSSSHQSLSRLEYIHTPTTLLRSPSHNTYFSNGKLPLSNALVPTENLSDEAVNKRFSAFIESRFATMKREMME